MKEKIKKSAHYFVAPSLVLIILMYIGRIGPLSLVLVFVHKDNKEKFIEWYKGLQADK